MPRQPSPALNKVRYFYWYTRKRGGVSVNSPNGGTPGRLGGDSASGPLRHREPTLSAQPARCYHEAMDRPDPPAGARRRKKRSALGLAPEHARAFLFTIVMHGVDLSSASTETDEDVVRLAEGVFASLDLDTPLIRTTVH